MILATVLLIFFGIATPTESAALGAFGALLLVIMYRALTWEVLLKSIKGTLEISGMILIIIAASSAFTQLLAFTGASRGLLNMALGLEIPSLLIIVIMLLIVVFLDSCIDPISIMMITLPVYIPMVIALDYDPIWFGIMMLICLDLGNLTPPFGLLLFVMKGVSPPEVTMKEITLSAVPFVSLKVMLIILIMMIPEIATMLPSLGK